MTVVRKQSRRHKLRCRLFRHDKHLVLMFVTRVLAAEAHLCHLVDWLKI